MFRRKQKYECINCKERVDVAEDHHKDTGHKEFKPVKA